MAQRRITSVFPALEDREIVEGVTHPANQLPVNGRITASIYRIAAQACPGLPPTRSIIELAARQQLAAACVPVEDNLSDYVAAVVKHFDGTAQARAGHLALAV